MQACTALPFDAPPPRPTMGTCNCDRQSEDALKILHTADLHLRKRDDERWQALCDLLEMAAEEEVDAFLVCGDMFDAAVDAEELISPLRQIFSGRPFRVLLLPGNHDREAYSSGRYFGDSADVLEHLAPERLGDATIVGLPFQDIEGEELMARLRELRGILDPDETNILLYHGELLDALPLDTSRADFGEEGSQRYMPVRLSYFDDLPVRYVLAGHFHRRFSRRRLGQDGWFVYPGSPVSITRRETGPRQVNLFEVGNEPAPRSLDTPHYETVTVRLDPSDDVAPEEAVAAHLAQLHPAAMPLLRVEGYVDCAKLGRTESELVERIADLAEDCADTTFDFHDISRVLQDELFQEFSQRVKAEEEPERADSLIELALRAMREVGL